MDTDWDSLLRFTPDAYTSEFADKGSIHSDRDMAAGFSEHVYQVPTPPDSHDGSPVLDEADDENVVVSVSTTFYPGAQHLDAHPDLALLSSDAVFFYVHSSVLQAASDNYFHSLIPLEQARDTDQSTIVNVPEDSAVLNIILHAIYDMSCTHFSPAFQTLATAVSRLPLYGIRPNQYIAPPTPLYSHLLSHAPIVPVDLYILASQFDLYDLAVSTSPHLLSFPLYNLTDEMAMRMGAVYLKRLFFLHYGRTDALKRVLLQPPQPHPVTKYCDVNEQMKMTRAWSLATAYLAWDARPDLPASTIESALNPLADHLPCDMCRRTLRDQVKHIVVQWSIVKRTI